MARRIYKRRIGPIPPKWEIHHIDGDFTNNDPSNLKAVSYVEHKALHASDFFKRWDNEKPSRKL